MSIRILGVDPGFHSLGVARISATSDGQVRACSLEVVNSQTAARKQNVALWGSADGVTRANVLWRGMHELATGIDAVAYKVYAPFNGCAKDDGKMDMAWGLILAIGFARRVPVIPVLPPDLKLMLTGCTSASEAEMVDALAGRIIGFAERLARIPESERDHASNAAGVAVVGLEEIQRLRTLVCAS